MKTAGREELIIKYNNIDKNKINPQTIHWSLIGDNEYIFNNYEGFAGWRIDQEDSFQTSSHWYANTPDIFADSFAKSYNAMTWCNRVKVDELNLDNATSHSYLKVDAIRSICKRRISRMNKQINGKVSLSNEKIEEISNFLKNNFL